MLFFLVLVIGSGLADDGVLTNEEKYVEVYPHTFIGFETEATKNSGNFQFELRKFPDGKWMGLSVSFNTSDPRAAYLVVKRFRAKSAAHLTGDSLFSFVRVIDDSVIVKLAGNKCLQLGYEREPPTKDWPLFEAKLVKDKEYSCQGLQTEDEAELQASKGPGEQKSSGPPSTHQPPGGSISTD